MGIGGNDASVTGLAEIVSGHVAETNAMRILAGEEGGARGAAAPGVVELSQAHSAASERVKIGRFDFTAEGIQITETEIIDQDVENVGSIVG